MNSEGWSEPLGQNWSRQSLRSQQWVASLGGGHWHLWHLGTPKKTVGPGWGLGGAKCRMFVFHRSWNSQASKNTPTSPLLPRSSPAFCNVGHHGHPQGTKPSVVPAKANLGFHASSHAPIFPPAQRNDPGGALDAMSPMMSEALAL